MGVEIRARMMQLREVSCSCPMSERFECNINANLTMEHMSTEKEFVKTTFISKHLFLQV